MSLFGKSSKVKILSPVTEEEEKWILGPEEALRRREQQHKLAAEAERQKEKELKTEREPSKTMEQGQSEVEMKFQNSKLKKGLTNIQERSERDSENLKLKHSKKKKKLSQKVKKHPPPKKNDKAINGKKIRVKSENVRIEDVEERSELKPVQTDTPKKQKAIHSKNRSLKHHEPENMFQLVGAQEALLVETKPHHKKKKSVTHNHKRTKTAKSKKNKKGKSSNQNQKDNLQKQHEELRKSIQKSIKKSKSKMRKQLQDLKREDYLPEDDGYLDDIMQFEQENWNKIDIRDELIASLVEQQRQIIPASQTKKVLKVSKGGKKHNNYEFERLKKSIERQNYMKVAKNFDSNLRLGFDEVKTLNQMNKEYNPYPDHCEPLVTKGVRFLTLDIPKKYSATMRRKNSQTLTPLNGGRAFPKIPRIAPDSTKNSRPIFMVRRPLSIKYNQNRKKYLFKNSSTTRSLLKMKRPRSHIGSGQHKLRKMVGFDDVIKFKAFRVELKKKISLKNVRVQFLPFNFDQRKKTDLGATGNSKYSSYDTKKCMPILQNSSRKEYHQGLNPNLV